MLDEIPHTVIGVAARDALPRDDVDFLVPFVHSPQTLGVRAVARPGLLVTARLKPGVTPEAAEAELNAIMRASAGEFGPTVRPLTALVVPLRTQLTGAARPAMLMLLGAGLLVLLIACANVANLLLARATARTKEMAVRAALGAGTARIVRQVLAENILLALLGGGLAAALACLTVDLLGSVILATVPALASGTVLNLYLTGGEVPGIVRPEVDWTVLTFAFTIAAATGIGCGLFPAVRACRADVNRDLKAAGRGFGAGRTRTQSVLVAAEVGLAALLLVGAGLFLRSFANALRVDPGFRPEGLYAFELSLPGATYPDTARRNQFIEETVQQLAALPGIESASAATDAPFYLTGLGGSIARAGDSDRTQFVGSPHNYVHPDFFRTLRLRLLRGRDFTAADNQPQAPRVLILSEALARALFGEQDPIGKRVTFRDQDWEVVGIAADARFRSIEGGHARFFYLPLGHVGGRASVLVRSSLAAGTLQEMLTKGVRALDPAQPVALRSMPDGIGQTLRGRRTVVILINSFAAIALVLACLGIYGVMTYTIGQRQRELGIRMALGASQPNVVALVLRDGLRLAALGLGLGVVAAMAGGQLIESLLFGVSSYDPLVYAVALSALALIAIVACWLPARRATSVDPLVALRED